MFKQIATFVCCALTLAAVPAAAQSTQPAQPAQPPPAVPPYAQWQGKGFVNVNVALQSKSRQFDEQFRFSIYEEDASFSGVHEIDGGTTFDLGGGLRVWRNLGVGMGFFSIQDTADLVVAGEVPHPLFFSRPRRDVRFTAPGLKHKERAVHLQAIWMVVLGEMFPPMEKLDVAVSFGPSFYNVKQEMLAGVAVQEGPSPFTSVTATSSGIITLEDSAVGFNIGADLTYMITPRVGAGFLLRYTAATAHFNPPQGERLSLEAGGLQIGVGARLRF